MEKLELLYEGKAKKVYATSDPEKYIVSYKDSATAFNGEKKGEIVGKGEVNNLMSNIMFQLLAKEGIKTHFISELNERETLVRAVSIVPLEVIVRNVAAGSFSKRFGVAEGTPLKQPTLEFCLKDDALGDPMINTSQILALSLAVPRELERIAYIATRVNEVLSDYFDKINVKLIDFKIEVGRTNNGEIILADEISPDTCRLWDKETGKKLDKDRFRQNLGEVEEAYQEMLNRVSKF